IGRNERFFLLLMTSTPCLKMVRKTWRLMIARGVDGLRCQAQTKNSRIVRHATARLGLGELCKYARLSVNGRKWLGGRDSPGAPFVRLRILAACREPFRLLRVSPKHHSRL